MLSRALLEHFEPSHYGGLLFMLVFSLSVLRFFMLSGRWEREGAWVFVCRSFVSSVKKPFLVLKREYINREFLRVLLIGILGLNLSPLCPICPSITVYITLSLCIALPLCLSSGISKWYDQPRALIAAITGSSGRVFLGALVFLSMVARAFLRPLRLCIRIRINALVGHLLLVAARWSVALLYVPGALRMVGGCLALMGV